MPNIKSLFLSWLQPVITEKLLNIYSKWVSTLRINLILLLTNLKSRKNPTMFKTNISKVPSITENLISLFTEMKSSKTQFLIVDLRDKGGGDDFCKIILEYFLYSLDSMMNKPLGYEIPRYSDLYLKNYTKESLESIRNRTYQGFQLGDFDFSEQNKRNCLLGKTFSESENKQRRSEYIIKNLQNLSMTFDKALGENRWNATWTPKVFVVTSASTFSAALDIMLTLRAHGAKTIGVPSGQAPNAPGDVLSFKLNHSKIEGQVSFKICMGLPDEPAYSKLLPLDHELTYAKFKEFNFDPNASILLAMEDMQNKK